MTEKHFETILAVLAEKVKEQENKIGYLEWKCGDLQAKLTEAEEAEKENERKETQK